MSRKRKRRKGWVLLGLSLLATVAEAFTKPVKGPVRKPLPPTVPSDARPSLGVTVWCADDVKLPSTRTRSACNAPHWTEGVTRD